MNKGNRFISLIKNILRHIVNKKIFLYKLSSLLNICYIINKLCLYKSHRNKCMFYFIINNFLCIWHKRDLQELKNSLDNCNIDNFIICRYILYIYAINNQNINLLINNYILIFCYKFNIE